MRPIIALSGQCDVFLGGYEWVSGHDLEDLGDDGIPGFLGDGANRFESEADRQRTYLVPMRRPRKGKGGWREYSLFDDHPGLFRAFADTAQTSDDVRAFVSNYGQLTLSRVAYPPGWKGAVRYPFLQSLESLDLYCEKIARMRAAVQMLDTIQDNLDPVQEGVLERLTGGYRMVKDDRLFSSATDLKRAAWDILRGLVNSELESFVRVSLEGPQGLMLQVGTLASLLWLQIAQASASETRFKRCEQCGTWMPLEVRADRRYCSDACRSKSHRERKADNEDTPRIDRRRKEFRNK